MSLLRILLKTTRFMNHEMPATPPLQLALVDVRDVAKAHVLCIDNTESDGHRILITSQPSFWFRDIAKVLAREFRDTEAKQVLARLNRVIKFDNAKSQRILEIEYTNPEKSLIEMAYSMIERGVLPRKGGYKLPET
uniref:Uncharacterized protein n=1 Tax=Ditylenchus dipsaci TaxID=166011 RepID=A0A915EA24_9BILA